MKMQLRKDIEFRSLAVNCKNFQEEISKAISQFGGKVAFVFKSETMHKISKEGLCKYYTEGYTADDGICMTMTHGPIKFDKIAYTIYPFDILEMPEYKGVESVITAVYSTNGFVCYSLPLCTERIECVFVLEYKPK